MRHLLVLSALLLSTLAAAAQTEKTAVSTLPGEENLSARERAERDFLMPVRRPKVVADPKPAAEEVTAAPETDGTTTAHFDEAPAVETRPEEVGNVREARAAHATRLSSRHRSTRSTSRSSKAKSGKAHSSKSAHHSTSKTKTKAKAGSSKKASATKKAASAKKAKSGSTHKTVKKTPAHKSSGTPKRTTAKKHRR